MTKLSAAFLKAVGQYMLVDTDLACADVCLLFGNPRADHLAEHAAELYHQGYFKTIVVSGGVATDDGRLEAHRMRDVLVQEGVPLDNIIIEDKATNTGENVINTMALLEEKMGLENIRSLLAVGHIQASRRFLMTLEEHWPRVIKMFSTENPYDAPREEWHTHDAFRQAVMEEYAKVPGYKACGFIAEVDISKINQRVSSLPQPPRI